MAVESVFFVAGGTLAPNAPSYVERQADTQLRESLMAGRFAYVLDSRQIGKSSLMNRTAEWLRGQGVRTATIDLTRTGQSVSIDGWYRGLLDQVGASLGLRRELAAFWKEHEDIGPLQRFMQGLEEIALGHSDSPLVLFVDEVDATLSLSFSADEFFAGIRSIYSRRGTEPALEKLTFCLLGSSSPDALVQDVRTTPFNIGDRIVPTDFTLQELKPFAQALSQLGLDGPELIGRVHHWTAGHPYLTQRLCSLLVRRLGATVDELVRTEYLAAEAKDSEHLASLSRRILESEPGKADRGGIVDLVRRLPKGVTDMNSDQRLLVLKLSGLARVIDKRLRFRCRIYELHFGRVWVEEHMPDAEKRRQTLATRSATLRTGGFAFVIVLVISWLGARALALALELEEVARSESDKGVQLLETTERLRDLVEERDAELFKNDEQRRQLAQLNVTLKLEKENALSAATRATKSEGLARYNESLARTSEAKAIKSAAIAKAATTKAERENYRSEMLSVPMELRAYSFPNAASIMDQTDPKLRDWEWKYYDRLIKTYLWRDKLPGTIWRASFSPDGKYVVAACEDGNACVFTRSGKFVAKLEVGVGAWSFAFSRDGRRLVVTSSQNKIARVFETAKWKQVSEFREHKMWVMDAAFLADGKRVVSSSYDGAVRIWDADSGLEVLEPMLGSTKPVGHLAVSPDGRYIVSGGEDGTARVWDAKVGKLLKRIEVGARVNSVVFSPTRNLVFVGSGGGEIWDIDQMELIAKSEPHHGGIESAAFSPDGSRVAFGCDDGSAWVLDAKTNSVKLLHGRGASVTRVRWEGDRIVTASRNKSARIFDANNLSEFGALWAEGVTLDAAFSSDLKLVVTATDDGHLKVFEAEPSSRFTRLSGHTGKVNQIEFTPDGRQLVSVSSDGTSKIWNTQSSSFLKLDNQRAEVTACAVSLDGTKVITTSRDGSARIWDVGSGRPLWHLEGQNGPMLVAAFSPDGKVVATGADDGTTILWSTSDGRPLFRLQDKISREQSEYARINAISFSADSRKVVTSSNDQTAIVWSVATGKPVAKYPGQYANVIAAMFLRDDRSIVTGSDSKIRIYSGGSLTPRFLMGHTKDVLGLTLSPDGAQLLSTSLDQTARLWRISDGALLTVMEGTRGWTRKPSFTAKGARVVFIDDQGVQVREAETGRLVAQIPGDFIDARFSPDGTQLAVASRQGWIDLIPGRQRQLLKTATHRPSDKLKAPKPKSPVIPRGK